MIFSIQLRRSGAGSFDWRDFGNGLEMSRLAQQGKRELVPIALPPMLRRKRF
jgi:hypothetical protein